MYSKLNTKKQIHNGIKKEISDKKQLVKYRIVNGDLLRVRNIPSIKKQIIGYLFFGDVVQIIKKNKNWCFIRKYDEEYETIIQGWVFPKYLSKIK